MIGAVGDNVMLFGEWLKAERKRRGWNQAELADRAGLSAQGISHIEKGIRQPGRQILVGLSRALNMSIDDLNSQLTQPITTLAQLRAEGIPADVLGELEHYAPDLLLDDWEMMVDVARRTARKNATRRPERGQRPVKPAEPPSEPDTSQGGSHPRKSARRLGARVQV